MGHDHSHRHTNNKKALTFSFFLISFYLVVEVIGGIMTNSLALLSDAGHMLSDAVSLGLSLFAIKMGEKKATNTKTYGYKRFEILVAFLNGLALIFISLYILWEAFHRLLTSPEVMSTGMIIISSVGLVVNIVAAFLLMKGDHHDNLNVRSAFLHVLGDLLGSIGAIVAAVLILLFGWNWADPVASIIVAFLVIVSGIRVTRDSFHVLMEGTPSNLNTEKIKEKLLTIDGIKGVQDLHIWSISSDFPALSCHIVVEDFNRYEQIMTEVKHILSHAFHIEHTTIQVDKHQDMCGHCH
ncbi:cation diffusion facilitator family transporter [Priestia filamentosa]|uniref:Zinc transporter ZitB n=1 Tax=Priestia filamentosa TaxID=1402861 RepID=A0A1X7FGK6_9BACI|nr:cation diffusion facilitator family transporter [Priestia filamentosa]AKO91218.1 zinc transporter ZitB [Priestia filamentosa]MDT3765318.1 cation diffusion facilitator family transporter [Priestia filamentosa]OXS67089.1 cation transporter [Priestia filamentosa]RJS65411.1 cation transporter [Priestia filamentosa]WRU95816.1 cation diffusion facilitator family transporter [Priestia filamentosa]